MELASEFVTELRKKENLKSVQNVIKAYGDLPQYWVSQFENYLKQRLEEKKIEHWHVGRWYSACVYVDGIIIDNINFGFDLYFTSETVHIVPIARGAEQQRNKEHLRQKMGERWPFLAGVVNAGNQYTIIEETGEKAAYEAIDAIITAMRAAGASD